VLRRVLFEPLSVGVGDGRTTPEAVQEVVLVHLTDPDALVSEVSDDHSSAHTNVEVGYRSSYRVLKKRTSSQQS
jgi:hypothetical protein